MIHIADGAAQERAKYAEIWSLPEYQAAQSPGAFHAERFMAIEQPEPGASVIDLGAGACQAGLEFKRRGMDAWWLDITDAARPPEVPDDRFVTLPLWGGWRLARSGLGWDYGYCVDVLEHIPPEYTMLCAQRIIENCRHAWLQIALVPDEFGKLIGEPLHLTVRSFDWWLIRLATLGRVIDARDLCGTALYRVVQH